MIMEMRDGVLSEFTMWEFLRFLLFMPTFSSGPIDRFKRFNEDYENIPEKAELLNMLEESVHYLMFGFLYKFILAYVFGSLLLPQLKSVPCKWVVCLTLQRLVSCMLMGLICSLTLQVIACLPLLFLILWALRAC